MKRLNVESLIENNPLRSYVRERYELRPLRRATGVGVVPRALYFPCGDGKATALLLKHFSLQEVSAIDQDERLVEQARRNHPAAGVDFSVGDVRSLDFADDTFDAVFDLADLHNYAEWQRGLRELRRVLKPDGLLIVEELSIETFTHAAGRVFRALTRHPYDSMFTVDSFRDCLLECELEVLSLERLNQFGLLKYFTVIARKPKTQ
jgi:ubiquinone/menaquinone biosynthesis C-methylase UbiE